MNKSESIAELSAALAKAQGEFAAIPKNRAVKIQMKSGGSFNFKYADLEAILGFNTRGYYERRKNSNSGRGCVRVEC